MRKHKKTRQEKIIADLHRKIQYQRVPTVNSSEYTIAPSLIKQTTSSYREVALPTYAYLKRDLIKIFLLTSSILASQTILFFLLKQTIVTNLKLGF